MDSYSATENPDEPIDMYRKKMQTNLYWIVLLSVLTVSLVLAFLRTHNMLLPFFIGLAASLVPCTALAMRTNYRSYRHWGKSTV